MSGEGILAAAVSASTIDRAAAAALLDTRAASLEASVAGDRVQPHSKMLPTEHEMDRAKFAARQLRIAADDLRAELEGED